MRKSKVATDKESALEIIELATNDFETLAKAFNLIAEVCAGETESEQDSIQNDDSFELVH